MRAVLLGAALSLALIPGLLHAEQPAPTRDRPSMARPSVARRALGCVGSCLRRGAGAIRSGWSELRRRQRVGRGLRQTVAQHTDELKPILAEGKSRTRTARRIKWGATALTGVSAAASVFAPVLIPVAVGAGATALAARHVEKRGVRRARVEVMKQAMLQGHAVPAETAEHYRPLVQRSITDEMAAAKKTVERGQGKMQRMKGGLLRARDRARSAVESYRRKKAPYLQLRDQVRGASTQLDELGRQLQQLGASADQR